MIKYRKMGIVTTIAWVGLSISIMVFFLPLTALPVPVRPHFGCVPLDTRPSSPLELNPQTLDSYVHAIHILHEWTITNTGSSGTTFTSGWAYALSQSSLGGC